MTKIGVLALQGDFLEHKKILVEIGSDVVEVRLPEHLNDLEGLIIPGGESTTIVQLIDTYNLRKPLQELTSQGLPVWGTCAGMIVMSNKLTDKYPTPLNLMNITVSRNAFGRQLDSFETELSISELDNPDYHAVFIRAPSVCNVGENVEIIAQLEDGTPVAVKEGNALATSFHPELTNDNRMHQYFLKIVENEKFQHRLI